MKPITPRLPFVVLAVTQLVAGCGGPSAAREPVPAPPITVDVVVGDGAPSPAATATATPAGAVEVAPALAEPAANDADAEPVALPKSWSGPVIPGLSHVDALKKARWARDAFGRLTPPAAKVASAASAANAKDATVKTWFGQAQSLVDLASRMYAASFHAADATREGRIDAIAEAAELDMTMARTLDAVGLGSLPVAWRADPAVASTFEDIAVGPTRRWRDEARVLARQCIDIARDSGVVTDAARRCATLRTGTPQRTAKHAGDAGAGCACSAGDPLCSASLGGWCGPAAP